MCIPIDPERILARGEAHGHEWAVVHNGMGVRCGYVKVGPGHPWHGVDFDAVLDASGDPPDVHGGLTFAEHDTPCQGGGEDDGFWLGFDAWHHGDRPDPSLPCPEPLRQIRAMFATHHGEVRAQAYIEAECKQLCRIAAEAAQAAQAARPRPAPEVP